MDKPEWFLEKFPLSKVPALEKDNQTTYESLITCDFLDEAYPDPPLYPDDLWQKANDKALIETWGKVSN